MNAATVIENAIIVISTDELPNNVRALEVACDDSDEYAALPSAVKFEGRTYGKTGWNSDYGIAFYRTDAKIAFAA